MPQYLAPGVYVEEIAGPRTIQGVSTSTAAFVGPCRFGPTSGRPELLTSYQDFVNIYGDSLDLQLGDDVIPNYLALGVKGFFDEGGSSLYVSRIFNFIPPTPSDIDPYASNYASALIPSTTSDTDPKLTVRARFPGLAGRMSVTFTLVSGRNALVAGKVSPLTPPTLNRVHQFDVVYAVSPGVSSAGDVYVVHRDTATGDWTLTGHSGSPLPLSAASAVYPISVEVSVRAPGVDSQALPAFGAPRSVGVFGFDPRSAGGGVGTVLTNNPPGRALALTEPIALEGIDGLKDTATSAAADVAADDLAIAMVRAIFSDQALATAESQTPVLKDRQVSITLAGGSDGLPPTVVQYSALESSFSDYQDLPLAIPQRGLPSLEAIDDISIVAVPGASTGWIPKNLNDDLPQAINSAVITHCEKMLYRVAALDTPPGLLPDGALSFRNQRSSDYAALYYPWITIPNPSDGTRLQVPPSAYMAGIWARTDNNIGVIKAPANEVVRSALDLEFRVNKAQQELLNPEGVNCSRYFPGPGFLVWGARTISDDPEWKYLSMRRYFNYLEKSIDHGTQWVVFEVNGPQLWDAVRHTVEGFLLNEWKSGALLGSTPAQGYFVKCDASTMTADDLDNGRLICQIGVAAAKPAEFVIFRIGQWTASASA